ncbi:DUF488 domain-containing protein [Spirosoma agri]|uniref:DUF488 domain-containing protein n=1 Tax=Spirosoma agri TaxID=1987381 RepID=A0A6M0IU78_9BACT|nr:DUF488 domain-containing protein [Spirosoma agri]NEU70903.1 DUF488 domain-containing protein [Spirosoma agri]
MMYYRRKVLLSIFEAFGGELGKIDLQKLLLIYTRYQAKPSFDFLPHLYGCYSFQAGFDLRALKTYGYIKEHDKKWSLIKKDAYAPLLKKDDQDHLKFLYRKYASYNTSDLIKATYIQEPYYAIRSEIAETVLSSVELERVKRYIPNKSGTRLFTIGYEGISIETYFNKLITNNIKVLCDVRRNPLSQKVGFSKSELKYICDAVGITYVHIPQLGIASEKRQNLETQKDYNLLFEDYEKNQLIHQGEHLGQILNILQKRERVALTCFEASYLQCHRGRIANAVTKLPDWDYELIHI